MGSPAAAGSGRRGRHAVPGGCPRATTSPGCWPAWSPSRRRFRAMLSARRAPSRSLGTALAWVGEVNAGRTPGEVCSTSALAAGADDVGLDVVSSVEPPDRAWCTKQNPPSLPPARTRVASTSLCCGLPEREPRAGHLRAGRTGRPDGARTRLPRRGGTRVRRLLTRRCRVSCFSAAVGC